MELLDLTGMVALVTGAGDGIGAGCAEILAAAGAKVVVSNRTLSKAESVVAAIKAAGGEAVACACNVLEDADLVAVVDFTLKTYDKINILINNAGGGGESVSYRPRVCGAHLLHECVCPVASLSVDSSSHAGGRLRQYRQHLFNE